MMAVLWVRWRGLEGCHLGTCQLRSLGGLNSASNWRMEWMAIISAVEGARARARVSDDTSEQEDYRVYYFSIASSFTTGCCV